MTIPENMQIDMGAFGKGYTGDLIVDILQENDIESALLDLGGNIRTIGTKPDGAGWKLGLKTTAVISYLPFLLVFGCISGVFMGACVQMLINRVKLNHIFH